MASLRMGVEFVAAARARRGAVAVLKIRISVPINELFSSIYTVSISYIVHHRIAILCCPFKAVRE